MKLKVMTFIAFYFAVSLIYCQERKKLEIILNNVENKQEFLSLANYYLSENDSKRYNALIYLLENTNNFLHSGYLLNRNNNVYKRILLADSLYFNIVKTKTYVELKGKAIQDSIRKISNYIQSIPWGNIDVSEDVSFEDNPLNTLSADKIKDHIDHCFFLRENSPIIKNIPEEDFYNYVLPYQARFGRYISASSKDFYDIISKYIACDITDVSQSVKFYSLTIDNFRNILGIYPFKYKTGFEEVFFKNVPDWDCYDVSNFGTAILNAIGIPTKSENVIAYKMLRGRHSHCAILESAGNYSTFSLEGADFYPIQRNDSPFYNNTMNIIEEHFMENSFSPNALKNEEEKVPDFLSNPRIEDITNKRLKTVSETIKLNAPTSNNLCYLASFNSYNGKSPVTWAAIDKNDNSVTFDNIILNRLYFPVLLQDQQYIDIASPFMYVEDSSSPDKYRKIVFDNRKSKSKKDIFITHKFPRKENMIKVARDLIGTTVIASDKLGFKDADTLYTLDFELLPYLQDLKLNNSKAYQYYKIESPAISRKMNLSEVQYLTSKSFLYKNIISPTDLPLLHKKGKHKVNKDLVRVLEDSIQKISKWPEYDGKMTTAPSAYPNVTFRLKFPQVITHIRVAPLNADNGIEIGNTYRLLEYVSCNWIPIQEEEAKYNYIYSEKLRTNTLYWLKNLTKGTEELAFYINDKKEQVFIYN
ncbi:hypothetical protein ABE426_09925 [Sphingobacterium faecium]|uniref:hypothetical protein n=1 Tax=Sphingobacterium faecium TaxID=34087 RepID=UPI003208170F